MNGQVQNAVATLRWTGSWYTVFITAERKGEGPLTTALRKQLKRNINRYRLAGQDTELEPPQYVSLQIDLTICVDPDYFRADVETALMRGRCGLWDWDLSRGRLTDILISLAWKSPSAAGRRW